MKQLLFLSFAVLLMLCSSAALSAVRVQPKGPSELLGSAAGMTLEEFTKATPKSIRERTGHRLSLKEVAVLKMAQRKVKKDLSPNYYGEKSQVVAVLLAFFLGVLGIHRFYLGYTFIGIVQLLTGGCCGLWALIDFIRILLGDLGPADGSDYYDRF